MLQRHCSLVGCLFRPTAAIVICSTANSRAIVPDWLSANNMQLRCRTLQPITAKVICDPRHVLYQFRLHRVHSMQQNRIKSQILGSADHTHYCNLNNLVCDTSGLLNTTIVVVSVIRLIICRKLIRHDCHITSQVHISFTHPRTQSIRMARSTRKFKFS